MEMRWELCPLLKNDIWYKAAMISVTTLVHGQSEKQTSQELLSKYLTIIFNAPMVKVKIYKLNDTMCAMQACMVSPKCEIVAMNS